MFSRLEAASTGHDLFRWHGEEFEAISAIQPWRKEKQTNPLRREEELLPEVSRRRLDTVFLSSVAAIFVRSEQHSFKFQKLLQLLEEYFGHSRVIHQSEELPESEYNSLFSVEGRPAIIAAMKADASLLFSTEDDRERFEILMQLVQRQSADTEKIAISEIGSDALFRGNDVMARIDTGTRESALFKPDKNIQTKQQLYTHLVSLFELDEESHSGTNSPMSMKWIAAEALFAARENVGVTQEARIHIQMQRPDRAFLFCYLFGTNDPSMPVEYQATARKFDSIYSRVKQHGDHTPEALERLRGWTPEQGAKNPEKVNGGFQGDTIFFQELLFESIDGIEKTSPEFEEKAANAVALVRGEPVLFMDTLRKLADILSRKQRGLPFPENETTAQLSAVLEELRDVFSGHPNKERIFAGRWFDASVERNPDYQIDEAEMLYYLYTQRALSLSPTVLQ